MPHTAATVETQLTPIIGLDQANLIASVAQAIEDLIAESALKHFNGQQIFPAVAALYGRSLYYSAQAAKDSIAMKEQAARMLELLPKIVEATNAPDPNPDTSLAAVLQKMQEQAREARVADFSDLEFESEETKG